MTKEERGVIKSMAENLLAIANENDEVRIMYELGHIETDAKCEREGACAKLEAALKVRDARSDEEYYQGVYNSAKAFRRVHHKAHALVIASDVMQELYQAKANLER